MNWEKFKKYYDNITKIEEALIIRRFNEYMAICYEWTEANKPEIESRLELFKIGWVMACIESD